MFVFRNHRSLSQWATAFESPASPSAVCRRYSPRSVRWWCARSPSQHPTHIGTDIVRRRFPTGKGGDHAFIRDDDHAAVSLKKDVDELVHAAFAVTCDAVTERLFAEAVSYFASDQQNGKDQMPVLSDDRDGHRYPEHARSSFAFGKAAAAGDGAHKDRLCRSRAEDRRACPACGTEQKAFHRRVRFGIRGHTWTVYPVASDRHGVPAPHPHRPVGAGDRRALRVRQRILFQPDLFGQDRISADRIPKKLPKRIKNERVCVFCADPLGISGRRRNGSVAGRHAKATLAGRYACKRSCRRSCLFSGWIILFVSKKRK